MGFSIHGVVAGERAASDVWRALRHAGIEPSCIALSPRLPEPALARAGGRTVAALAFAAALAFVLRHDARAFGLDLIAVFVLLALLAVELSLFALAWHDVVTPPERAPSPEAREFVVVVEVECPEDLQSVSAILRLASDEAAARALD